MGFQILKQPDGQLAVFSSETDTFVAMDATPAEVTEWFADLAAQDARTRVCRLLDHVLADDPRGAYYQFALTWAEAARLNREHDGELTYEGG
jgi:hypothetical protein